MSIDLGAIKARADAATEGPWILSEPQGNWIWPHICNTYGSTRPDAEFIAHAREDIPALVAEVERLREIINAQKARPDARRLAMSLRSTRHAEKGWRRSYEKQRAENDRLRAELAAARGFTLKDGAE